MAADLEFYQIYYKDDQLPELYDFAIPYFNKDLTLYFENTPICDIVPKSTAERICVASWRLAQKRGNLIRAKKQINREDLIDDYDVAILTPRSPTHRPLYMAYRWHGIPFLKAINELKKFIKVPDELKYGIYENHFIARGDIYKDYVTNCLIPAIDFMSSRPVFFTDSGYAKRKPQEEVTAYKKLTGRNDWPMSPFVLERLFSIWIHYKNLKVVNK